ncbi:peptidase dimerization domain protein [Lewinellaceae bacterium SD302]|nr:peptidase dimerization domain protein [Lewinellaceae bacterium SD302]
MQATQAYIQEHKDRFLEELKVLLRIPSISADAAYAKDVQACAGQVAEYMVNAGLNSVEIIPTPGHPIVYGEKMVDASKPTVLIYGHYDVQPPDPLELWDTEPFDPVVKKTDIHPEGAIFARGTADDKGQFFMHVKAVEAMIATGELPCNVKMMIEGEEEVGSDNLEGFLRKNTDKLKSDVILVSDTSIIAKDTPSITTGLRGLSYVEVKVTGPNRDLHSGVYGGAVANPLNVLCNMISSMMDENKHVTIPGFYDNVAVLSDADRKALNEAPFNEEDYKEYLGIGDVEGEAGYTTLERTSIRPTLDVNGIWGGYTGEGAKTVLPSKAEAKISMRLVPNQDPDRITQLFEDHFKAIAPNSVQVEVNPHHGGQPSVTPTDTLEYKAAHLAMQDTFGKAPIPKREGGSIPIVALFEEVLNVKSILMGFGLDSDGLHSPNEHYGLFNFYKGIETIPHYFKHYTALK